MKTAAKKSDAIEKSIDFELNLTQKIRRSEQRAWWVAIASMVCVIIMASAFVMVMPLKEKIPYIIQVDSYTGSSSLTKLAPVTGIQEMALNEAVNKANISHYMLARESYDWEIIGRRDWYVVNAMSSKNVATAYAKQFDAINPDSPDILFGRTKSVRIKIKSLILSAKDEKGQYTLATVRFDKFLISKNDDRVVDTKSLVATLNFEYISSLTFEEKFRVENPIGFVVNSYRVDPEYATPPSAAAVNQSVQQASEKGAKQ